MKIIVAVTGASGAIYARQTLERLTQAVMAVRETPLSLIHLRNMTALTEAGAIILPASPSFYFKPRTLDDLCMTVTERILSAAGVDISVRAWGETE